MRRSILRLATALALACICMIAGAQGNQQKLNDALSWLHKIQGGFSPEVKKDVPALESILHRYFMEPDTLRASEEDIAVAFLDTMPKDTDLEGRGGTLDKLNKFEALLGGKPKAAPTPKPKPGKPKPKPKPPVKVVVKHKIPGVHSKASFVAEARSAPGGKTIGVVQLNIAGRSKTVVEVLAGTSKMDAKKRAQVVASRMQRESRARQDRAPVRLRSPHRRHHHRRRRST